MRLFTAVAVGIISLFATEGSAFVVPSSRNNNGVSSFAKQHSSLLASPFDQIANFFTPTQEKQEPEVFPPVVIDPSFKLSGIFLASGIALDFIPYIQLTLGPFVTLLGLLFLVQTFRIRFVFNESDFELRLGDSLNESGENVVVGGENRWSYDSFVNWEFFPKGWVDKPQGPILAYFKETQTPSDKWDEGPGKSANSAEALAKGAVPGQVHFFPVLCDAQQLRAEFEKRNCAKL
eukprot:CAMPEP_0194224248 /NCGR_PEP_ID=MMETSP0156-20130528/37002_1 /TAXON_ID=33649 /ORGANISM="Thalassionema nitzschioides, Strain L26-B" /LENGTH=233 /DNA_ID=CAMNT_0038955711 /DNA_START=57 /DNA_END=758 /DNA_ORIENTATION=+